VLLIKTDVVNDTTSHWCKRSLFCKNFLTRFIISIWYDYKQQLSMVQ